MIVNCSNVYIYLTVALLIIFGLRINENTQLSEVFRINKAQPIVPESVNKVIINTTNGSRCKRERIY